MRNQVRLLGLLLGGTILGTSLSAVKAQEAASPSTSHETAPAEETVSTIYHPPAPNTPQATGVNAANLPDIDELPIDQLPQAVPQESANPKAEDWPAYGRDDRATRYSPLTQITPENVSRLQRAFVYHTGVLQPKGKLNRLAPETAPIKVGDSLYLCSATNDMMRVDAATGQEKWHFHAHESYDAIPFTSACKSVTYYTSSTAADGQTCHNRIIEATLDNRMIAVDAEDGKPCEAFGHGGQVNLMQGMGWSVPRFVGVTSPVPIINGVIVVNHEVLDGQRRWAPSGVIRGYDAESGKFLWAWDVNNPDNHHQPDKDHYYSRGTPNSWTAMTGDNALGLVYVPMGNSSADYYSAMRSDAENKVSSAVVALDVRTGEPRWVFQTVHKDVWDYDIGSQATLFDYHADDGSIIPALIMPTKRGQTFILDRRTGKPLPDFPVVEKPAPAGVMKDDPRTPTQPWSVGVPRLGFPDLKESDMWGVSPLDQLACRIKFRRASYVGEFTPPSLKKPWIESPGYNGGSDWGSISYNPQTGIMLANWNNVPMYNQLVNRKTADQLRLIPVDVPEYTPRHGMTAGNAAQAETPYGTLVGPFWNEFTRVMCNAPPYGMLTAIDLKAHKVLWQRPFGSARANGPWGLPTGLPIEIGTPNNGGSVMTAGGVAFIGASTDNQIHAVDLKTGKTLWTDVLPGGGQANAMTYAVNGRQYVAIMAGGHHLMGTPVSDQLVVYTLPGQATK
ncbi:pyrroloquinoline quinone-dependent dehydrogenase [Bombella apis]|uniref:pyrroloquinoline quinone-dependent dehydrogenase n=1 Tax=Bombella apis TaxID=1785988 RepID=UPI0024A94D39|nr:pyrroloquinoline quinone-dependent dehydrogenase [Bombella apis]